MKARMVDLTGPCKAWAVPRVVVVLDQRASCPNNEDAPSTSQATLACIFGSAAAMLGEGRGSSCKELLHRGQGCRVGCLQLAEFGEAKRGLIKVSGGSRVSLSSLFL